MKGVLSGACTLVVLIAGGCEPTVDIDPCARGAEYETSGPDGGPDASVTVVAAAVDQLVVKTDAAEFEFAFPRQATLPLPSVGEELSLDRFSAGSALELGIVTGEVAFVPVIELTDANGIIAAVRETSVLVSILSFSTVGECSERDELVNDAAIEFETDDGAVVAVRRWI